MERTGFAVRGAWCGEQRAGGGEQEAMEWWPFDRLPPSLKLRRAVQLPRD